MCNFYFYIKNFFKNFGKIFFTIFFLFQVHSKLRNGGAKGRGGRTATTTGTSSTTTNNTTTTTTATTNSSNNSNSNSSNTPSSSPTPAFLPPRNEKRKSKDDSPPPLNGDTETTKSLINPVTGLNVQISTKKCKTTTIPCAISPILLECPEQDCSKKYKHANGLRYHQSHAHGSGSMDEDSQQEPESPRMAPPTTPSPAPSTPTPTPQPVVAVVQPAIPTTTAQTVTLPPTQVAVVLPVIKSEIIIPGSTLTSTITTATTTTTTTPSAPIAVATVQQPTTPNQSQPPSFLSSPVSTPNIPTIQPNAGLLTPISLTTNQTVTPQINSLTPLTGAGGSITAGISNQMVTQQNIIPGGNLLLSGTGTGIATDLSQQMSNNGIISTPTRGDPQSKIKSGVLRFGPTPTESEINRMPGEFYFHYLRVYL